MKKNRLLSQKCYFYANYMSFAKIVCRVKPGVSKIIRRSKSLVEENFRPGQVTKFEKNRHFSTTEFCAIRIPEK